MDDIFSDLPDTRLSNADEIKVEIQQNVNNFKLMDRKDAFFDQNNRVFLDALRIFGTYPQIQIIEEVLAFYNKRKNEIIQKKLPELMQTLGMSEMKMADGTKLSMSSDVSVKQIDKFALCQWLENNGYGDHIKTDLAFGKGEFTNDIKEYLDVSGISYTLDTGVHSQTLKKIMRDIKEEGGELPPVEVAEVNEFFYTKVK